MGSTRKELFILISFITIVTTSYLANDSELKKFEQGNVDFTGKFLYEAAKSNPAVSLISSPFSVLFLLAQLALYATGNSLYQLLHLLNFSTKDQIRCVIPRYIDTLNLQQNVTFDLAARVYGNIQYKFCESFEKDTRDTFKAEAQNLDFCKQNEAANTINDWVACQTHNLIQNLISPDSLNCDTILVLVNAIYFKGDWLYQFDPKNTKKKEFYVNKNKNVEVNMMKQTGYFKYTEISYPDAQVLELPYKSNNFSLLIWLPKSEDGIDDMINTIGDSLSCSLSSAINSLTYSMVDVSIPTIDISTTTNLQDILKKDNVTAIFSPTISGLTGIVQDSKPIYVSSAIQKATIVVNELGSEAAAANALVVSTTAAATSPPLIMEFNANHPFVYFILFQETPIFSGICYGNT